MKGNRTGKAATAAAPFTEVWGLERSQATAEALNPSQGEEAKLSQRHSDLR